MHLPLTSQAQMPLIRLYLLHVHTQSINIAHLSAYKLSRDSGRTSTHIRWVATGSNHMRRL